MKRITIILFILSTVLIGSCSTDEPGDIILTAPPDVPPTPAPSVINMQINGVDHDFDIDYAAHTFKLEDTFIIGLGEGEISFHKSGRFGYCELVIADGSPSFVKKYYSKQDFSSNYFTLHLDSYDEVNKRVRGYFSGYVYRTFGSTVESKFVNGTFDLFYEDIIPVVGDLGNSATINGVDWVQTNSHSSRGTGAAYENITLHTLSDDPYKIILDYQRTASPVGTYNFSDADATNKVKLAKFDPISGTYTNYICTGTLVFNRRHGILYGGTYQFTAVNPNNPADIIQVTNGVFKFIYVHFT